MATDKPEMDFKTLDRRIAARMIRRGQITEKELEKGAKGLPDSVELSEPLEAQLSDPQLDGSDED